MKINSLLSKLTGSLLYAMQYVHVKVKNPSYQQAQLGYLCLGVALLSLGIADLGYAQTIDQKFDIEQNQFLAVICAITRFLEGAFGALIMVISGIGAIVSAAFGQYKAAIGLLVVAVGAFVLRSLVATFFGESVYADCTRTTPDGAGVTGQE